VVNKAENNEQIDADILQCKADILRAHDIIPPDKKKAGQELKSQKISEDTPPPADAVKIPAEKEKTATDTSSIPAEPVPLEDTALLPSLSTERVNHTDTAKQPEPERAISSQEKIPEAQAEQIKPGKDISVELEDTVQEKTKIPKFDLAEEIMAEQRKITSIKRKAPGKKIEPLRTQGQGPEAESIGHTIEQPTPVSSEQNKIIAEIVARDIERLCRGDYLADRG